MLKYILKRILMVIPVLLGVTVIIFLITRVLAPDPAPVVLGEHATPEAMAAWRADNGLDDPIWLQYVNFVVGALQGDLGTSYYTHQPVTEEIAARFPATAELAICAIIVAAVVGVALGVLAAVKKNKAADNVSMLIALVGVSMPIFWSGILLILLFAGILHVLPSSGASPRSCSPRRNRLLHHRHHHEGRLAASATCSSTSSCHIGAFPVFHGHHHAHDALEHARDAERGLRAHGARQGPLEGLGQHQARPAQRHAARVHGHRPAVRQPLGGALLTETVFAWPGIGKFAVDCVLKSDFPVVQGIVLLVAVIFVVMNLVVDIIYAWLDPRIKYGTKEEG